MLYLKVGREGCMREESFTSCVSLAFTQLPRPPDPALSVNRIVNKVGAALQWLGRNWRPLGFREDNVADALLPRLAKATRGQHTALIWVLTI